MKYKRVGNSGLMVSEIAYGSWLTFGNQVELAEAKEVIQKALDLGINYIDTADVYNRGEAERLLGEILPQQYRANYIVATKAFWPMGDAITNKGLSRKHIVDSVHASLERLKLDYMDIFYCHRFDPETPMEETLWAIHNFICSGKIIYWGTSEWTAEQIKEAHAICDARGWHKPVMTDETYTLLEIFFLWYRWCLVILHDTANRIFLYHITETLFYQPCCGVWQKLSCKNIRNSVK